jgi:diguanylate cyclase (GGDEF)-like protein
MHNPPFAKFGNAWMRLRGTSWLWLQIGMFVLSALLLASAWTFALLRLEDEKLLVIENARLNQQNLAHIIAENLSQVLERGALFALVADNRLNAGPVSSETKLAEMLTGDRAYNRIALFDHRGRSLYASSSVPGHDESAAAIREYLAGSRDGSLPPMRVGQVSKAQGELWQVPIMLPVKSADDELLGVLVLDLDLGYLLRFYQDIDLGKRGIIQVFGSHGIELARARRGGLELVDPAKATNSPPDTRLLPASRVLPLLDDKRPFLSSFHPAGNYPFVVAVNQDLADVLDQFQSHKDRFLTSMLLLTAIILMMTAGAVLMLRRLQHYFEAIVRSEEEKQSLIEQLEGEKQHAYEMASHDHLTGMANRRMFMELGASHIARARRSRQHYALMFVDLDRFKAINDTLGHRVGDLLLQLVSQRMRDILRESDVIARFGGDEFVILLTGLEREADVVAIAEKLVEVIGEPCTNLDGHDVQIGSSIGVALYPRDGQDLETLIHHADAAMYQSKKVSRGSFTFFDQALNVSNARGFELEQRLPKAIAENELILHYQPKVDLSNYHIIGFEALVRWQHPDHGLIFPNDFIELAEGTSHIVGLGNWVIDAACAQLAVWRSEGLPVLPIAINISSRQLRDTSLPGRIADRLAKYGLEPALLQVEVTESSLIENIEIARGILDELVATGIRVALDDFGNGFSSLGYIKTLPIDIIKIDRTFVRDILNSSDDAIIVESTIILGHNLGMRVIAEGVETRGQLIHLRTAGCDEVQGYYFSRPVAHEQARQMLLEPMRTTL